MVSEKLKDLLDKGIAGELQVSVQYMWQHVLATGLKGAAIADIFKETAITEMKHAEHLAERLIYLGGTPTTKPDSMFIGGSLTEMIETMSRQKKKRSLSTNRPSKMQLTKAT